MSRRSRTPNEKCEHVWAETLRSTNGSHDQNQWTWGRKLNTVFFMSVIQKTVGKTLVSNVWVCASTQLDTGFSLGVATSLVIREGGSSACVQTVVSFISPTVGIVTGSLARWLRSQVAEC